MKNLLLVDDDKGILEIFAALLQRHFRNINVSTAGNGQEAVKILAACPIDLMITDLQMPVMTGIELAEFRKQNYPHIPLIVMTGELQPTIEDKLLALGVRQFILKPFDMHQVITKILCALHVGPAPASMSPVPAAREMVSAFSAEMR